MKKKIQKDGIRYFIFQTVSIDSVANTPYGPPPYFREALKMEAKYSSERLVFTYN